MKIKSILSAIVPGILLVGSAVLADCYTDDTVQCAWVNETKCYILPWNLPAVALQNAYIHPARDVLEGESGVTANIPEECTFEATYRDFDGKLQTTTCHIGDPVATPQWFIAPSCP